MFGDDLTTGSKRYKRAFPFVALLGLLIVSPRSCDQCHSQDPAAAAGLAGEGLEDRLLAHLNFLCSDTCAGRASGSKGIEIAGQYIAEQFKNSGVGPFPELKDYYQSFTRMDMDFIRKSRAKLGVQANGSAAKEWELNGFTIPIFSGAGSVEGPPVMVGFGREEDYARVDDKALKGKIGVVIRGDENLEKDANPTVADPSRSRDLYKAKLAQDHGLAGLVFISPPSVSETIVANRKQDYYLPEFNAFGYIDEKSGAVGIPVVQLEFDKVYEWFGQDAFNRYYDTLEDGRGTWPAGLFGDRVSLSVKPFKSSHIDRNVIGFIPGSNLSMGDQMIVVCAHYDHIGRTKKGEVCYGADDNGSGTAALIEMARTIQESGLKPGRSILFAAVAAEEPNGGSNSVTGSQYLLDCLRDMGITPFFGINMDMIGRGREKEIVASFLPGAPAAMDMFRNYGRQTGLNVVADSPAVNPRFPMVLGDQIHFFLNRIPYVQVYDNETGGIHTSRDKIDRINLKKLSRVTQTGLLMLMGISRLDKPIPVDSMAWNQFYRKLRTLDNRW
jgi:hypothetical protein